MPLRSDLSGQQVMTQWRIGATGTYLCTLRYDLSRQRVLAHRRIETTRTSLCITIRFVLLLKTVFHYEMICPDNYQTCP